jgi:pyridoxamine 5'-phosphate oxidase
VSTVADSDSDALRERLRRTPALTGPFPGFEVADAGAVPGPLFVRWLTEALDDGVPEPHVMTLGTADAAGRPSSRVLMLRGFDPDGCVFFFASDAASRKGRELAVNPYAALSWYWPGHGRQIRATGRVETLDRDAARADFLGRSEASRVAGFTGLMSAPLDGPADWERGRARALDIVTADPQAVPEGHSVYALHGTEVEFFQGDPGRFHRRLRYVRDADGWRSGMLWP